MFEVTIGESAPICYRSFDALVDGFRQQGVINVYPVGGEYLVSHCQGTDYLTWTMAGQPVPGYLFELVNRRLS